MATIITYDLPSKHREVKAALFTLGYTETFLDGNRKTVYLPNTTLHHSYKTPAQALQDLRIACSNNYTRLLRCITTQLSSDWTGDYGEPL